MTGAEDVNDPQTQDLAAVGAWFQLRGKVCVVTGAGSGIGAETARLFARMGARVGVLDRDGPSADAVARDIGSRGGIASALRCDVSDPSDVQVGAQEVLSRLGPCDVLVNNAATRHRASILEFSLDDWNRVLGVNLTGALLCSQAFARQMIGAAKAGSIVHVGSVLGHHPQVDAGAYSASKAALGMLSRSLSVELAPHRIRSNVISPGFIRTPANEASYADPVVRAAREALIPSGRPGTPEDLAQAIVMLASERSSYINGEDILVDGAVDNTLLARVPRPGH